MSYLELSSPQLFFILTGLFAETVAFLFYKRFKLKTRRLAGTGRMTDIEVAHNWKWFFSITLIAIPVLVYMLQ